MGASATSRGSISSDNNMLGLLRERVKVCFMIYSDVRQGVSCPLDFSMYLWMQ